MVFDAYQDYLLSLASLKSLHPGHPPAAGCSVLFCALYHGGEEAGRAFNGEIGASDPRPEKSVVLNLVFWIESF